MNIYNKSSVSAGTQLTDEIRSVWINHVLWIRSYIICAVFAFKNLPFIRSRIYENFEKFFTIIVKYYGYPTAKKVIVTFTENFKAFEVYLDALKSGDPEAAESARETWYKTGDTIADYMADINKKSSRDRWLFLARDHLRIIENEVLYRFAEKYGGNPDMFGRVEGVTLQIADFMAESMINEFNI